MNKQIIEDNIMARVVSMAETRKASNARENFVMVLYTIMIAVALLLMVYLFRQDKLQALLSAFHIETRTAGTGEWSVYYPLIAAAAGLSVLAFISYAIARKSINDREQVWQ